MVQHNTKLVANDDPNIGANFDWTLCFSAIIFKTAFACDSRRGCFGIVLLGVFLFYTIVEMESDGNQSDF